jgi:hypothetical protein
LDRVDVLVIVQSVVGSHQVPTVPTDHLLKYHLT